MTTADLWAWVVAHDWQIALVGTYVLLNIGPRPHPENLTGSARLFWLVVDRLAVLSAEKVPGSWKMIFQPSELPPRSAITEPPRAADETDPPAVVSDRPPPPGPPPPTPKNAA